MLGRLVHVEVEAAQENLRNLTLAKIPGDFGRLIYLASLRDYNAGEYHHAGLIQQFGAEVARDAILLSHREVFNRVVRCSIAELVRQIELYAASTHTLFADFAHTWEKLEPYRVIVPLGGDPLASRLFVCNVRAALAVLQGRQSRAPQDPQFALPRQ